MIRPPPKYPLFPSPPFSRPLEEGESALAGLERVLEFPRHDVDVGEATLSEGANVVEASEVGQGDRFRAVDRSEEHTSELQSRPHLVCRLLLEKKRRRDYTTG